MLLLGPQGVPLVAEGPQLPDLALCLCLGRQGSTGFFQFPQGLFRFICGFPCLSKLGKARLHFGVGQGLLVVVQLPQPFLDLVDAHFQLLALGIQRLQLGELLLQRVPLGFRLGKQTGAVITAAIFQIL